MIFFKWSFCFARRFFTIPKSFYCTSYKKKDESFVPMLLEIFHQFLFEQVFSLLKRESAWFGMRRNWNSAQSEKKIVDQMIKFFAKIAYRHDVDTNAQKIERKPLLNGSQIKILILRNKDVCIHFLQLYNFETNFRFRFFHNFSISVSI